MPFTLISHYMKIETNLGTFVGYKDFYFIFFLELTGLSLIHHVYYVNAPMTDLWVDLVVLCLINEAQCLYCRLFIWSISFCIRWEFKKNEAFHYTQWYWWFHTTCGTMCQSIHIGKNSVYRRCCVQTVVETSFLVS